MGQTSLQILNRTGSKSFWNNSWDNKFLYQNFFLKFLILEKIIHALVNKKCFSIPKLRLKPKVNHNTYKFKNYLKKKKKKIRATNIVENYHEDICKSKLWVFKYHNWIILCIFILTPYKSHKPNKKIETPYEASLKKKVFKDFFFKDYNSHVLKRKRHFRRRYWKKSIKKRRKRWKKKKKLNKKKKKKTRRTKLGWLRFKKKKSKRKIVLSKINRNIIRINSKKKLLNLCLLNYNSYIKNIKFKKSVNLKKINTHKLNDSFRKRIVFFFKKKFRGRFNFAYYVSRAVSKTKKKWVKTKKYKKEIVKKKKKLRKSKKKLKKLKKKKTVSANYVWQAVVNTRELMRFKYNSKSTGVNFRMLKYKKSRRPLCVPLARLLAATPCNLFDTLIFKTSPFKIPKKIYIKLKTKQEFNFKFLDDISKLLHFKNDNFGFDFFNKEFLIKKHVYKSKLIFLKKKKLSENKPKTLVKSIFLKFKLKNKSVLYSNKKVYLSKINKKKKKSFLKKTSYSLMKKKNNLSESKSLIENALVLKKYDFL